MEELLRMRDQIFKEGVAIGERAPRTVAAAPQLQHQEHTRDRARHEDQSGTVTGQEQGAGHPQEELTPRRARQEEQSEPTNTMSEEYLDLYCTCALLGENMFDVNEKVHFMNTKISFVCQTENQRVQIRIRGNQVKCVKICQTSSYKDNPIKFCK